MTERMRGSKITYKEKNITHYDSEPEMFLDIYA